MRKYIIALAVAAAFVAVLLVMGANYATDDTGGNGPDATPVSSLNKFDNRQFGFGFDYPKEYFLDERQAEDPTGKYYFVSLTEDTEENRMLREGKSPIPREGPVEIFVSVYSDVGNISLEQWVRTAIGSNFQLSPDGQINNETLGSKPALAYRWSGLYEGKTIAVKSGSDIILLGVSYITPEDVILSDFDKVRTSFRFK